MGRLWFREKRNGTWSEREVTGDHPLPVTTAAGNALGDGDAFIVGTGKVELSLAGHFRAKIVNGTADKLFVITALITYSSVEPSNFASIKTSPTTVLANSAQVMNGMITAADDNHTLPSGIAVTHDTDGSTALDGTTRFTLHVPQGRTVHDSLNIIIQPQAEIGFNHEFTGAASAGLWAIGYVQNV